MTQGMTSETTSVSSGRSLQKSVTFLEEIARTSGSASRKSPAKVPTRSEMRISWPNPCAICDTNGSRMSKQTTNDGKEGLKRTDLDNQTGNHVTNAPALIGGERLENGENVLDDVGI